MVCRFTLRALNTDEISADDYGRCYNAWGGSFIIHPDVLRFFADRHGVKVKYRGFFRHGQCVGAVPVWGKFIAGDRSALIAYRLKETEDFGYPVIYLPIDINCRCTILYKTKCLLGIQSAVISGAIFSRSRPMAILKTIPDDLSHGMIKEFEYKKRKFERLGGSTRDVQDLNGSELADIYAYLHERRWGGKPHAWQSLRSTFSALKLFLFGKILYLKNEPIAVQINYRAETSRSICIDYINGGAEKSLKPISPGSLLSYINGANACGDSRRNGKILIYSYGRADNAYKNMWCNSVPRGTAGFWLP